MKKTLSVGFLAFALLFLASCSNNNPKDVAKEWLTNFYHFDYEAAKKMGTQETKTLLTSLEGFALALPDSVKQHNKKLIVRINGVKEEGDKATVTYTLSDDEGHLSELHLVKDKDKWLVQFSKADMADTQPDSTGQAPAGGATIQIGTPPAPPANPMPDSPAVPDTSH